MTTTEAIVAVIVLGVPLCGIFYDLGRARGYNAGAKMARDLWYGFAQEVCHTHVGRCWDSSCACRRESRPS